MNSKTARIGLMFAVTLVLSIGLVISSASWRTKATETMAKVHMLNIGQGDSFLIEAENGAQLLLDGGRDATVLSELSKVMAWNDKKIDVIVATHPDADHVGGLVDVIKRYDVGLFLTSDVVAETQVYKSLIDNVLKKKIPAYYVRQGMNLAMTDKTSFTVLFPDRDTHTWETNTASVVGRLQIGDRSVLFTGDSPVAIEQYLAKTSASWRTNLLDVDILKLGHHGSKTSTSQEYLKATTPQLALISAGVNNSYGHPHKEVLDLLRQFNISYVSTQTAGTMTLETDGLKWDKR
ncbi:MAG: MBL fold metallo-hydrolase [Patescibacteria group bacterium]